MRIVRPPTGVGTLRHTRQRTMSPYSFRSSVERERRNGPYLYQPKWRPLSACFLNFCPTFEMLVVTWRAMLPEAETTISETMAAINAYSTRSCARSWR